MSGVGWITEHHRRLPGQLLSASPQCRITSTTPLLSSPHVQRILQQLLEYQNSFIISDIMDGRSSIQHNVRRRQDSVRRQYLMCSSEIFLCYDGNSQTEVGHLITNSYGDDVVDVRNISCLKLLITFQGFYSLLLCYHHFLFKIENQIIINKHIKQV